MLPTLKESESSLPPHLVAMPGGPWALWRWAGLRGAGFPAASVLTLAAPAAAQAADAALAAEAEAGRALELALAAVHQALDELRGEGQWEDAARREPLLKTLRTLKKGKWPEPPHDAAVTPALEALQVAVENRQQAQAAFGRAFAGGLRQVSEAIRQAPGDPLFREAVTWQNRQALHSGILALLDKPESEPRSKKQRQQEELIANYLQRYCVKNDTIGFFGPVGWARWVDHGEAIKVWPGPGLLEKRAVYFEGWGIDALAQTMSQEKALRPWMRPRRLPYFYLEGEVLMTPSRPPLRLAARTAAVLQACDGQRTARQLAQELIQTGTAGLQSEAEVLAILEELLRSKLIVWAFELPLDTSPERQLRGLLEGIEDEELRRPALAALDELETARDGVAAAAGDAERLDQALSHLEETFNRLTATAPTRAHGQVYSGRTLVYEDCRRDVKVELGGELLEGLGPPLALLLASARWFAHQVAAQVREVFWEVYGEMGGRTGEVAVSAMSFAAQVQPRLFSQGARAFDGIGLAYQQKWAETLAVPAGMRSIHYDGQSLRPAVLAAFHAPDSGWEYARYHSPDVMIAADGLEAIRRGDYQLVLGEIHPALNTLGAAFWLAQHPSPQELFQAVASDMPGTHLMYAIPKNWPSMTTRTHRALLPSRDFYLAFGHDPVAAPVSQVVPIGALVIEEADGRLVMRSRDGRLRFDLMEAFAHTLTYLLGGLSDPFGLTGCDGHTPRITIDNLVVAREAWRTQAADAPFAYARDEGERFLEARRWAQAQGMPRFVFGRVPVERKPFYVDFDSPVYVNILAKMIRRTAESEKTEPTFTISEMLPRPDQTWLADAQGCRYTSELRLVALDLAGPSPLIPSGRYAQRPER